VGLKLSAEFMAMTLVALHGAAPGAFFKTF
jgi:hypothetical protein